MVMGNTEWNGDPSSSMSKSQQRIIFAGAEPASLQEFQASVGPRSAETSSFKTLGSNPFSDLSVFAIKNQSDPILILI